MYWRDDHQCIFHRGYMFGFPSTDTMDDLGPINPSCWANSLIKTGMDSGTIVENAKQTSWECSGIYNDIHIYIYICPYLSKHHGLITVFHVIFDNCLPNSRECATLWNHNQGSGQMYQTSNILGFHSHGGIPNCVVYHGKSWKII